MTVTATRPEKAPDSGTIEDERLQNRLGLVRLAVIVLLIAAVTMLAEKGGAVIVFTAVIGMIMLHELGHYITARWAGMKVTDFFVGFGPVIWSTQRGETRWGVRALPVGGYVKTIGMNNLEEVAPEDEDRTYRAKTYWQRVRFAMAGSTTHFLVALVLMVVLLGGYGRIVKTVQSTTVDQVSASLSDGGPASPAKIAGVRPGDKIVAVNGTPVRYWKQVSNAIHDSAGKPLPLTVKRDGKPIELVVTPVLQKQDGKSVGMIGIHSGQRDIKKRESWPSAVWQAPFEVKQVAVDSTSALVGLFSKSNIEHYGQQLTKTGPADPSPDKDGNRFLSMLGLFRLAEAVWKAGMASVLMLLISLNVFIGIFNLIPLPPFDGGHIAVATYEAVRSRIRGRRYMVDMNKMLPLAYLVMFALLLIGVTAFWLDLRHPINI
ncbi:MAG: hypothetical protein QOF21_2230 [Actinomycetota bacterium]|jgi:membrane-associated protease RseP (regulator of RpoE activity)